MMNGSQLLESMAQHELLMWLRSKPGWVFDADLQEAMDLTRAEVAEIRAPLVRRGFVVTCVGASRLTDLGRVRAGDIHAEILSGDAAADDVNRMV